VVLALGYWAHNSWEKSQAKGRREAATAAEASALNVEVLRRANSVNAVIDWPDHLAAGQAMRISPVLTIELQDLWLAGRPILFVGKVDDVARTAVNRYTIKATYGGLERSHDFTSSDLRIIVDCDSQLADPIVRALTKPDDYSIDADVAIVARIEQVTQKPAGDSEENSKSTLTGLGSCVDALYLGEAIAW
jgi:hypothetical protein